MRQVAAEAVGSNASAVAGAIHAFAGAFLRQEIFRGMDTFARMTSNALRRQCPSREAKQSISGRAVNRSDGPVAHIQCVSQIGPWMEYGTGLYGPKKETIKPKGGSYIAATGGRRRRAMLRWKTDRTSYTDSSGRTRKLNGYMYAPEVSGMPPSPWFWPTVETMLTTLQDHIRNAIQRSVIRAFAGIPGARLLSPRLPGMPPLPPVRISVAKKAAKARLAGVKRMQAKFARKMAAARTRGARGRR